MGQGLVALVASVWLGAGLLTSLQAAEGGLEAMLSADRSSGFDEGLTEVSLPMVDKYTGFTVKVQINGRPVDLMIDTGASMTYLSPEVAKRLGLKITPEAARISTASGDSLDYDIAHVDQIKLGQAWVKSETIGVVDMPKVDGLQGVLGNSTLADWDVRIDPSTMELTLFPKGKAPSIEGETTIPLLVASRRATGGATNPQAQRELELRATMKIGAEVIPVILDTGSGGILTLPSGWMDENMPEAMKEALPSLVSGFSASGEISFEQTKLPSVQFGPDKFEGLPVLFPAPTDGKLGLKKGLLGLRLLRHYVMTFSFESGKLRLKPLGTAQQLTKQSTAGINLTISGDGRVYIDSLEAGGPGELAGLKPKDEFVSIEGKLLKGMKPAELIASKQLPPQTKVRITYKRGDAAPKEAIMTLVAE